MNTLKVFETDVFLIGGGITATRAAIAANDEGAIVSLVVMITIGIRI